MIRFTVGVDVELWCVKSVKINWFIRLSRGNFNSTRIHLPEREEAERLRRDLMMQAQQEMLKQQQQLKEQMEEEQKRMREQMRLEMQQQQEQMKRMLAEEQQAKVRNLFTVTVE